MHCGMCLPTCPTYVETKEERNSPRGRIALMRAIADGELEVTKAFGEEMYYCLGCLACTTACPAGVNYPELFETARADVEKSGVLATPQRDAIRWFTLRFLFTRPRLLRFTGRLLWLWQATGLQSFTRRTGLTRLLPKNLRRLEPQAPTIQRRFSHQLIAPIEPPPSESAPSSLDVERSKLDVGCSAHSRSARLPRVAVLTGCVQDLVFADINRATVDVLLANGCEVHTPPVQPCCGSLHAHNGDTDTARELARRQLNLFDPFAFDAIISNAGGCGSHLRHYDQLLADDPRYAARATEWSRKLKDIHEFLVEIGFRPPRAPDECREHPTLNTQPPTPNENPDDPSPAPSVVSSLSETSKLDVGRSMLDVRGKSPSSSLQTMTTVTYHESCHLCHGQKVSKQPREILKSIPGLVLRESAEATWCCGSAGIYNITQPDTSRWLQDRKLGHLRATGAEFIATANPGCHLQIENGLKSSCASSDAPCSHDAKAPGSCCSGSSTCSTPSTPGSSATPQVVHPIVLLARAYRAETPS